MPGSSNMPQNPSERAPNVLGQAVSRDDVPDELTIVDPELKQKYEQETQQEQTLEDEVLPPEELPPEPMAMREKLRALFISYEADVFEEGSPAQAAYAAHGAFFEEVHVIVFTEAVYTFSGLQIAENVWAYPTNTRAWWSYPYDAFRTAREQLYFAKFFRADVVISRDPFELSLAAFAISRWFKIPLVVYNNSHVYDPHFLDEDDNNSYRVWWASQVITRAEHICVTTLRLKHTMLARHELSEGVVTVIPPYVELGASAQSIDRGLLHAQYPGFTFTLLVVAPLTKDTRVTFVINAVQYTLQQYPSIGLFVIGDGPERKTLEAFVQSKGLERQVIFLGDVSPLPYMASAGMLMGLTDDEETEQTLMQAVSLELPVITTTGANLGGILEHNTSALICKPGDLGCAIQSVTHYMNNSTERIQFAKEAKIRLGAHGTSRTESIEQFDAMLRQVVGLYRGIPVESDRTPTEVAKQDTL